MNLDDGLVWIKYLFYNIQYIHLINYCQCTKWNSASTNLRSFIMAHCCLYLNNIDQSIHFFLRASYNLGKEVYLKKLVSLGMTKNSTSSDTLIPNAQLKTSRRSIIISRPSITAANTSPMLGLVSATDENAVLLDYYTKTIHYYDLNGNLEAAIELIQNALLKCQFDYKSKSKLYCILFKSYMDLEYFDKAYISLMSNTDIEWKKICLKNFISELCNQNKSEILVSFDYGDLLNEVFNILMYRAKAIDLRTNDLYRVLFSLNIRCKNYRRAALCMYECYLRLQREVHGINSLKRQEKCLLTCLNVLKLVDPKFAWINLTDLDLP
ncbi:nuclear pore complex protein Nup160-like [Brachionus plicatilis]|uniref:Nuclear pore complex protein Nup160-like n=1 Tax=Brachionus plicatilis TaxID=10195 RepID=A0A3M7PBU0_BRAPC|nr:nuclear pore complex protein Nup160-like [Brachionus plicatilis]